MLLTVSCSTAPPATPAPVAAPPASTAEPAPTGNVLPASRPTRLLIPSLSVDTAVIDLGLNADGSMQVPPDEKDSGWYTRSPTPGELGPAVLAAHVDWKGKEGPFYDLREAEPGDAISVERADGRTAAFTVERVEKYPKNNFPTEEVYGNVDSAQLRLITCGGDFDASARSYRDNIVVFAQMRAGPTS